MWATVLVFAATAVLGATLAVDALRGRPPGVPRAIAHGLLAATGLVLLLAGVVGYGARGPARWALALFVLAAIGGSVLALGFHARRRLLPLGFVVAHAALALMALLALLSGALRLV